MTPAPSGSADGLHHIAFPYRETAEYLDQVLSFIRDGLARAEPVLVAVPGQDARLVRSALGTGTALVAFPDMDQLGRNPARITLALTAFASQHPGQPIRCVTEPMWPGRTSAETAEVMKHEALVNLALAAVPARVLCPYDASWLSAALIAEVSRTHPAILVRGDRVASDAYHGLDGVAPEAELPSPPPSAQSLTYASQLKPVRALVRPHRASRNHVPAAHAAAGPIAIRLGTLRRGPSDWLRLARLPSEHEQGDVVAVRAVNCHGGHH